MNWSSADTQKRTVWNRSSQSPRLISGRVNTVALAIRKFSEEKRVLKSKATSSVVCDALDTCNTPVDMLWDRH